ncbi:hypothetical protein B0A48_17989 [Cryoendolithus antarcticus]|uniref:Uncharacterized protein n=1 Tax=Cryoendolithus antarcticus TaxID=1507870 RepID=A0A1V8S9V9_9PEZI|nr:hypothetical protein B0A48_17989 [Cryoendolithus antarcticus]
MTEQSSDFDDCIALADRCFETAAYEEASRALDAAGSASQCGSTVQLVAIGTRRGQIERRKGNYRKAISLLEQAVAANDNSYNLAHVEIIGELGATYINVDEFGKARSVLAIALATAEKLLDEANSKDGEGLLLALSAKAQACRAIGNLGLAKYHIATTTPVRRKPMLREAIDDLEKRVSWAEGIQLLLDDKFQMRRLLGSRDIREKYQFLASVWRILGLGRLTLCYTALGEHEQALQYGRAAVESASQSTDPVTRGVIRFYYGFALLAAGLPDRALRQWEYSTDSDLCSSVIALCQEPSEEHCRYLRKMRKLKVRFDRHDGVGYTALDYAVLADHANCISIVTRGIRDELDSLYPDAEAEADRQVAIKVAEAHRRKQYREILQLTFRTILAIPSVPERSESRILELRLQYAHELSTDLRKRELFDKFRFISYSTFESMGSLPDPNNTDDMATLHQNIRSAADKPEAQLTAHPYVVFFSYEWRGRKVGQVDKPDDDHNTQYNRMLDAIEKLLRKGNKASGAAGLSRDEVFIWLDVASIDQNNRDPGAQDRGVSALPLVITLCNTMISLVDDSYFSRAWCAVEALLMQSLLSYGHHKHLEHHVRRDGSGERFAEGSLSPSRRLEQLQDVATNDVKYGVTKPEDRTSIRFLARQAKLLQKI